MDGDPTGANGAGNGADGAGMATPSWERWQEHLELTLSRELLERWLAPEAPTGGNWRAY